MIMIGNTCAVVLKITRLHDTFTLAIFNINNVFSDLFHQTVRVTVSNFCTLQKMLKYNPAERISAKAALDHPYFDSLDKSQF